LEDQKENAVWRIAEGFTPSLDMARVWASAAGPARGAWLPKTADKDEEVF
jgi:hypothetical protein